MKNLNNILEEVKPQDQPNIAKGTNGKSKIVGSHHAPQTSMQNKVTKPTQSEAIEPIQYEVMETAM